MHSPLSKTDALGSTKRELMQLIQKPVTLELNDWEIFTVLVADRLNCHVKKQSESRGRIIFIINCKFTYMYSTLAEKKNVIVLTFAEKS